jgi:hypothetical protein
MVALSAALPGRAAAQDRDPSSPGPRQVRTVVLDVAGVATELFCPTEDVLNAQTVVVVAEPSRPSASSPNAESAAALARHLATHGMVAAVPRLPAGDSRARGTSLRRVHASLAAALVASGADGACGAAVQCSSMGGFVDGPMTCYTWWAPPAGLTVAIGHGAGPAVWALSGGSCAGFGPLVLVEPEVEPPGVPDADEICAGESDQRAVPPFVITFVTDRGAGTATADELAGETFDTTETTRVTVHADPSRAILGYITHIATDTSGSWDGSWLYDERQRGALDFEYRTASRETAVTQFSLGLLVGAGGRTSATDDSRVKAVGALRPELYFGRTSERSLALGPYGEAGWMAISNVSLGGGAHVLVPIAGDLSLAPGAGIYTHDRDDTWRVGAAGGMFVGSRSFNSISSFDAAYGLRADVRADLEENGERAVFVAFQLDLTILAAVGAFAL